MAKQRPRTAFPARTNAMGYQDGLTKLEWVVTQLLAGKAARVALEAPENVQNYITVAQQILDLCKQHEQGEDT